MHAPLALAHAPALHSCDAASTIQRVGGMRTTTGVAAVPAPARPGRILEVVGSGNMYSMRTADSLASALALPALPTVRAISATRSTNLPAGLPQVFPLVRAPFYSHQVRSEARVARVASLMPQRKPLLAQGNGVTRSSVQQPTDA